MKILFAECCAALVVPDNTVGVVRWCHCGAACVSWAASGGLHVWSKYGLTNVSVIGLHNGLLCAAFTGSPLSITRQQIREILDGTPSTYLFKLEDSLVIRFRPGRTSDVEFIAPSATQAVPVMDYEI